MRFVSAMMICVMPTWGLATSTATQKICNLPDPCALETTAFNRHACATERAEWIVEGVYRVIGGVHTIEPAVARKGKPPLARFVGGEYYLWNSCWNLEVSPGQSVRAYGKSEGGVFYISGPTERHRSSVP
jgi:hypothetical protein